MLQPRFELSGIRKYFGATKALDGVDFCLGVGEVHALIGENGAGKSTLMKVLSGIHQADAGSMQLGGAAYAPAGPVGARQHGVVMIHQELTIAPHLTVAENIVLGNEPKRFGVIHKKKRDLLARDALAQLGADTISLTQLAGDLTIAQQQLIEIARALALQPQVLIMDEPTSSLTNKEVQHLFSVIATLRDRGVSIIYISHFLEECASVASRYTVLRDGKSVVSGDMAATNQERIIEHMVGRSVDDLYPRVPHALGERIVQANAVAGKDKPRAVFIDVHAGEICGIFGIVGAGRTEFIRCCYGLDVMNGGSLTVRGIAQRGGGPQQRIAAGLGLCSEDRKNEGLLLEQDIANNCTMSALGSVSTWGWLNRRQQEAVAAELIERLDVRCQDVGQGVGELSGGNQQKVALARLLHQNCDIILLDEPTRGVDVGAKATIYRLIGELAASGKAVLVVSSYIPELLGICDTVAVMDRGVLGEKRPVAEWDQKSLLAQAIGVEA